MAKSTRKEKSVQQEYFHYMHYAHIALFALLPCTNRKNARLQLHHVTKYTICVLHHTVLRIDCRQCLKEGRGKLSCLFPTTFGSEAPPHAIKRHHLKMEGGCERCEPPLHKEF